MKKPRIEKASTARSRMLMDEFSTLHGVIARVIQLTGDHPEGKVVAMKLEYEACVAMRRLRLMLDIPYNAEDLGNEP